MRNPWFGVPLIGVSASAESAGDIPLIKARTLSITARAIMAAGVDADALVYLYYSPDGNKWDTIPYTSFKLTYTAGETVQRTVIIDVPEHGNIKAKITNGSAAGVLTGVEFWYSIQDWNGKAV